MTSNNNGKYKLVYYEMTSTDTIGVGRLKMSVVIPWKSHSAIRKKDHNTLVVIQRGEQLELQVNGRSVAHADEAMRLKNKNMTLTVGTGQTVEFDNLIGRVY